MNHQQRLRQKKTNRRKEKIRQRQHQQRQHTTSIEAMPQFVFDRNDVEHVPPMFMDAVGRALNTIKLSDPELFSHDSRAKWRLLKKLGFYKYGRKYAHAKTEREAYNASLLLTLPLGDILYSRLLQQGMKFDDYFPMCDVSLVPHSDILVRFNAMLKTRGPNCTVFCSRVKPTIEINGTKHVMGFTRHALQRITERLTDTPTSYSCSRSAFVYFSSYIDYEVVCIGPSDNQQLAVTMYEICDAEVISEMNAAGNGNALSVEAGEQYCRLGYAPIAISDGFAVAKTFLTPGMRGTPEYGLLIEKTRSYEERNALEASLSRSLTVQDVNVNRDFMARRWFHDQGVKQIVGRKSPPFTCGPDGVVTQAA